MAAMPERPWREGIDGQGHGCKIDRGWGKIDGGTIDGRLAKAAAAESQTRSLNARSSTAPWTLPAVCCAVSGSIRPNSVHQMLTDIVRFLP